MHAWVAGRVRRRALVLLGIAAIGLGLVGGAPAGAGPGAGADRQAQEAVVHVKFSAATGMRLRSGRLVSSSGQDIHPVSDLIANRRGRTARLFLHPEDALAVDVRRLRESGEDAPDLNLWYRVSVGSGADAQALAAGLTSLRTLVDEAYVAQSAPPPPPQTGDFSTLQGYLNAPPDGIGAESLSAPGSRGSQVEIVDIEYSWNQSHEDLSKAAGALVANGTPSDPFVDTNHGTAVLGALVADDNGFGVTGIVPDASVGLVNAFNLERGYDLANAIDLARTITAPGDVILIEQQTPVTPGGFDFVPVEWVGAYYDAIKLATAAGRIVVEAAGNGGQNLDDAQIFGKRFPSGKRDSGAIIVGAGAAPGCTPPPRARMSFSSYGERVDLQGWGECVTTSGYGDLFNDGVNSLYTSGFSGTSSASAIVAGAAAALSSAIEAKTGRPARTAHVRRVLERTATPPSGGEEIGPLPNLVAAYDRAHLPS